MSVTIGSFTIPGGMIYVGSVPRERVHTDEMAECIDPSLPIDYQRPDPLGHGMDYWPAYHSIPPGCRTSYLAWLAGGRWAPDACIGYVFLYFYGLERRVLVDARSTPAAQAELPQIFAEVTRLLGIYSGNGSFRSYATAFQDYLRVLLAHRHRVSEGRPPDPAVVDRYSTPVSLRLGIGEFARDCQPVPVDWAYSWAMLHPEIYPRTAAKRCAHEFRQLFAMRYGSRNGQGMVVRPLKGRVTLSYAPASGSLSSADLVLDVPDVITAAVPTRALAALVESCTNDLDPYSRLIGRTPEAVGTIAAAAVLPVELLDNSLPALPTLKSFVDTHLGSSPDPAVVDGQVLAALWPSRTPGKLVKADAVALAQLLGRIGVGVEPDVRLGGPVVGTGPAVLFGLSQEQPTTASPEYAAAATLLHLAAVVSVADDDVSDAERRHLVGHLESALHLSAGERERLAAHLVWLLATDTKLTGLKKRLAALDATQRQHVADFLTMVAAIDGHISPDEVKTLRKIYTLLELDPETVYGKLHTSAVRPATEPVTVRAAQPGAVGYAIPQPTAATAPVGGLVLDQEVIEAKLAESAAVSALLADLFADDEEPEAAVNTPATPDVALVEGLDATHSRLARQLAEGPVWTRAELESLCEQLHVMVEGAVDTVNEAAMDVCGEPLIEDDNDDYRLNDYARGELLA